MKHQLLNELVVDLFEANWARLSELGSCIQQPSEPLVFGVTEAYAQSARRLLVVDQETHGWFNDFSNLTGRARIQALQQGYLQFDFGSHYRSTPFWRFAHELRKRLNDSERHDALAWTNLNAFDSAGKSPLGVEAEIAELGLVRHAVEIIAPDVVVFLTGPTYDSAIEAQFNGVRRESVDGHDLRSFSLLRHPYLPPSSFRVHHPAYLQRARRFEPTLADLVSAIQEVHRS